MTVLSQKSLLSELACEPCAIEVGMPHLDIFGISEMFCLTDSGHQHWRLLSAAIGRPSSDWIDIDGNRVYAGFLYSTIAYAGQRRIAESDTAVVKCRAIAVSMPYFLTETTYAAPCGTTEARVILLSAFLRREGEDNRCFVRTAMIGSFPAYREKAIAEIVARRKQLRHKIQPPTRIDCTQAVNPITNFNNAGFMYFANFTRAFCDLETRVLPTTGPLASREVAYFANINAQDSINLACNLHDSGFSSHIWRASDGRLMAHSESLYSTEEVQPATIPLMPLENYI